MFCDISEAFESSTRDYFTNCAAWDVQIVLLSGLQVIYLSVDNVLLLMVSPQIGSIFWLVSHKDLFLAHYYFSFTPNTLTVLSACLLAIPAWLVTFNLQKILSMIISRKRNPVFHRPLFMNVTMIKNTTSHNHLGFTFSNSGSWDEHVKFISEKL